MNISLPDDLKKFVDSQVADRGYGTSSEFLRELLRKEQDRLQLRQLVVEGMASPRVAEAGAEYFDALRQRASAAPAPGKKRR